MKPSFPPMHRGRCLLFSLFTLLLCCLLPGGPARVLAAPAAPAGMVRLRGHVPAAQTMTLDLSLSLRDQAAAEDFAARLYDPADPLYGHYITPEEFARRYCPTQQSYDAVAAFARARGLSVTHTSPNRLLLSVSGSTAAVESAFGVRLGRYRALDGRVFHAPAADPAIPASLVGRLSGIIGLDNAAVPHPLLLRRPAALRPFVPRGIRASALQPLAGAFPTSDGIGTDPFTGQSALTPSDIKVAYGLDQTALTGAGQILGLLELDTYTPGDIAAYEKAFGLPNVPLEIVPVDAAAPNFPSTPGPDAGEVTLDIEVMAAIAPGASKILVYESPGTLAGFLDQFNQMALDNRAKQISVSYGIDENAETDTFQKAENAAFLQMMTQGQSMFVASGDSGAYNDGATISVSDPASQPLVTAVGGTRLAVAQPGGPYQSESAWSDPLDTRRSPFGFGGGGGISAVWAIPNYQAGIGGFSATQRNVPDVALDADLSTGYAIYFTDPSNPGQPWNQIGGTSVASPIWAAFTALANQQRAKNGQPTVGFANPLIYTIGASADYNSAFHDVADGSNNLYPLYATRAGYDNSTGWGSFKGAGLLALFAPTPNTTGSSVASVALLPNPVVGGLSVTGRVTLANPAPSGGATVALASDNSAVAPVPASVTLVAGQTSVFFTFTTGRVTADTTTVHITATYQGGSAVGSLTVVKDPPAIVPTTLSLFPSSVNGGTPSLATVTLSGAAPKGGLVVTLTSSDPAAQVPANVTVPAGATTGAFTVTTSPVTQQVNAVLTASAGGKSVSATLSVLAPTLTRLVLTPPTLPGGQTATGTLTLTFAAPAAGAVVTLSSDNPAASVPATVTIPGAGTTTTFAVTTKAVPKTVIATITATLGGLSQTAKLEVRSARLSAVSVAPTSLTGGTAAVGTVTLDSPVAVAAGLVVALGSSDPAGTPPATVIVPLGATTATFPLTTAVVPAPVSDTLTASLDGFNKTAVLSVQPIQVTNLTLAPAAVVAGVPSVGTVTVNAPAPPAGLLVTLKQTGAAETVPASATVPAGATSVTFPIGTPQSGTVTVAAIVGGQTRTATLTVTTAVGTSFPAGLNMLSVPYDYSGQPLDTLFGYAGVRMVTENTAAAQYAFTPDAPADALRLGRAYFVKLPKAVTLTSVGTPADPTTDFSITLLPGWNMIGDPFLIPVSLGATHVATAAGAVPFSVADSGTPLLISSLLYSYSSSAAAGKGAYVPLAPTGSLQPGAGYWIYAYAACSLVIPHPGQ